MPSATRRPAPPRCRWCPPWHSTAAWAICWPPPRPATGRSWTRSSSRWARQLASNRRARARREGATRPAGSSSTAASWCRCPIPRRRRHWTFPDPFGPQDVLAVPLTEIVLISRHIQAGTIISFMNLKPLADLRDPATSAPQAVDERGRSAQRFVLDVVVRRGGEERRATAVRAGHLCGHRSLGGRGGATPAVGQGAAARAACSRPGSCSTPARSSRPSRRSP